MLFEIAIGLGTLGIAVYFWLTWHYGYWKSVGVKDIKPSLIFGNIGDVILVRKNAAYVYDNLYRSYPDEPAIGTYRLRTPELLLRTDDLVKTVLVKEFHSFHDNPIYVDKNVDPIFGNNPFVAKGENWKVTRNIHTPALTTVKLKGMLPLMKDVAKDMIEFLKQKGETPLEAKYFAGQYTTDVVASVVFGLSSNSFKDPNSIFRKMSYKLFEPTFRNAIFFTSVFFTSKFMKFFNLKFITNELEDFFKGVIAETCAYRKKTGTQRNDFLQQLLNKNEETEQKAYTPGEILGYSMTFFFDGYETSSVAISYIIYQLALNQDVQEKLRKEVTSAIPNLDDIDYEVLQNLPYLDAVISETLRLFPPVSIIHKVCTKDIVLRSEGREYPMKQGMTVGLPIYSIHRDPKYFQDPEVFRPERFYKNTNTVEGYFPFGNGPRACLGMRFALTQTKMAIASLVSYFQILPKENNPGPIQFDKKASILLLAKDGVWVKFKSIK